MRSENLDTYVMLDSRCSSSSDSNRNWGWLGPARTKTVFGFKERWIWVIWFLFSESVLQAYLCPSAVTNSELLIFLQLVARWYYFSYIVLWDYSSCFLYAETLPIFFDIMLILEISFLCLVKVILSPGSWVQWKLNQTLLIFKLLQSECFHRKALVCLHWVDFRPSSNKGGPHTKKD